MNTTSRHQDVQELLPWYATGSLNETDTQNVDQHLENCSDCRADLKRVMSSARGFHRADSTGNDQAMTDRQDDTLNNLLAEVRNTPRPAPTSLSTPTRIPSKFAPLFAAAATLLLALSGAWLLKTPDQNSATFELMSAPRLSDYPVIQILFHPQVPEQDLRLLLLDIDGELTGSPSPKGIYRVRLKPDQNSAAYVERLRQHPAVRWADVEL